MQWVATDKSFVGALLLRVEEAKTKCVGVCKTPYLCRIHACPASVSGVKGSSKYQCSGGDHSSLTVKGRYHESFCFYCSNPDCCNGKWFSRDETHARLLKRHKKQISFAVPLNQESSSESPEQDHSNQISSFSPSSPSSAASPSQSIPESCAPSAPPFPQEAQTDVNLERIPGEEPLHIIPEGF